MPKQLIDVAAFLKNEYGAEVIGKSSDDPNLLEVVAEGQRTTIDLNKLLQDEGVNPGEIDIQFGTKDAPLEANALAFKDQLTYAQIDNPKDKQNFLSNIYGKDNVAQAADGSFSIKVDNQWQKAETGFVSQLLGREGATIGGAMVGGEWGASLGSFLGPAGTAGGLVLGAGIGAIAGKVMTLANAHRMGIRSEEDANVVAQELNKDMIEAMSGEIAGMGLKAGIAGIKATKDGIKKLMGRAVSPESKTLLAEVSANITNKEVVDMKTWQEAPDLVASYQNRVRKWMDEGMRAENPVLREAGDQIQEVAERSKQRMFQDYDSSLKEILPTINDVKVNITNTAQGFQSKLKEFGLIDEVGDWIPNSENQLKEFVTSGNLKGLKQVNNIIKAATKEGGEVTFKDAQRLTRNLGEILELAGAYGKGSAEITSKAKGEIMQLRRSLNTSMLESLAKTNKEAAIRFSDMNAKYSTRHEWLDDLALATRDSRVESFFNKVVTPNKGGRDLANLSALLQDTGINSKAFIDDLFARRAAINTSETFGKGQGLLSGMIAGPRKLAPLQAATVKKLNYYANAVDYLNKMKPAEKALLVKNPAALRAFFQTIQQAQSTEEIIKQRALQGGSQ